MQTYYYRDGKEVKHITLNPWEYEEESRKRTLYTTEKEAKKSK